MAGEKKSRIQQPNRVTLKLVIAFVCVALVLLNLQPAIVNADGEKGREENSDLPLHVNSDTQQDTGLVFKICERIVAGLINTFGALVKTALQVIGTKSVDELVFSEPGQNDLGNLFTANEWQSLIYPWYDFTRTISLLPVAVSVVIALMGIRYVLSPKTYAEITETVLNFVLVVAMLYGAPMILNVLAWLDYAFVSLVKGHLVQRGILTNMVTDISTAIRGLSGGLMTQKVSPVLLALVDLNLAALTLFFNVIYVIRKVVVAILFIILPLAAWTWIDRRTRIPLLTIFSEVLTNTLMTTSHAIVLAFVITLVSLSNVGLLSAWWVKLVLLNMVIPLSALIRNCLVGWLSFLGVNEEKLAGGTLATIAGLGAIARVAGTFVQTAHASIQQTKSLTRPEPPIATAASTQPTTTLGRVIGYSNGRVSIAPVRGDHTFTVESSKIPNEVRLGDTVRIQLAPVKEGQTEPPEVINVQQMPEQQTGAGNKSFTSPKDAYEHAFGRATAALSKAVWGTVTYVTPLQKPAIDLAGAVGYPTGNAIARAVRDYRLKRLPPNNNPGS